MGLTVDKEGSRIMDDDLEEGSSLYDVVYHSAFVALMHDQEKRRHSHLMLTWATALALRDAACEPDRE